MELWRERTSSTVERFAKFACLCECLKCLAVFHNKLHGYKVTATFLQRLIYFLSTLIQLWNTFHPPDLVRPALERTLKTLQLDYVDLYIIEMPTAFKVYRVFNVTLKRYLLKLGKQHYIVFFFSHSCELLTKSFPLTEYFFIFCSQEIHFTPKMRMGSTFIMRRISVQHGRWDLLVNHLWRTLSIT